MFSQSETSKSCQKLDISFALVEFEFLPKEKRSKKKVPEGWKKFPKDVGELVKTFRLRLEKGKVVSSREQSAFFGPALVIFFNFFFWLRGPIQLTFICRKVTSLHYMKAYFFIL
jgi:hypothetical protein